MTRDEVDAALFAAALEAYQRRDYESAYRLAACLAGPAAAKLEEMAIRRMRGLGPAEPLD